ncbi:SPFH domain-containing protein [Streptomyces albipurpureus]|uniref:SPFH domain-containing protein n=1 Tax=Streptomyces albipurpureus TaxID=2897419 RepID=A0ABT0UI29_9ACTN|nr:SPFH domain-containing protein [Streptomyces sp. CWNU-1]MCM2387280.1 SPFH domain-containing protein [Streptomyces sp. CWNU-1]
MSPANPHSPGSPQAPRPPNPQSAKPPKPALQRRPLGKDEIGSRSQRLIHNEATTQIPVHLLFREDSTSTSVLAAPTAVSRRRGTAEQPRTLTPGPFPRPSDTARSHDGPDALRSGTPTGSPDRPGAGRPGATAPAKQGDSRTVPVTDAAPVERLARALPGAVGVLAGFAGLSGQVVALWWAGALPSVAVTLLGLPEYGDEAGALGTWLNTITFGSGPTPAGSAALGAGLWAVLALTGTLAIFGFGGLARGRVGQAWVLTLFGRYRGSVRRTGLMWVNPLLLRRRVDIRLRHWRNEAMPAVDAHGVALRVVVLVVWRVRDTARATLAVEDHQEYLRECVESAMARVLSQLPTDAFHEDAPTLRNAEAVGDALTKRIALDAKPVGLEVFSAQPIRIEYAPEVAAAMQRRRVAAIDALHRDSVLTSVVDSVEETVTRLTVRGLVELDDYERKALVKDLTVAFYTGRGTPSPS